MHKTFGGLVIITAALFFGCNKTITTAEQPFTNSIQTADTAAVTVTTAELKNLDYKTDVYYRTTDLGGGLWKYDSTDKISEDNTGTIIANSKGQRVKRINAMVATNATWFGLKGDGSDETKTLQAAINASAGKTLSLPSGTFFTGQLNIVSNITIQGNNTKLRMIQGSYDNRMLKLANLTNVQITGMELALNGISGSIWDGTSAIEIQNCSNIHIYNCFIHDNTYVAIRLIGGNNNIRISNNNIQNTDVGVHANNVNTNINVVSNTFSGGTSEAITIYGYDNTHYPTNFLIDSNIITGKQSFGINISFAKFGTITHNTISSCYGGVTMHDAVSTGNDNLYTSDMTIRNNIIKTATFGIIYVGDRTAITGNQIQNIQQSAISVNDFKDASIVTNTVTITGNAITASGLAGGGAAGIVLKNLTAGTVSGNNISQCGQSSSSIRFNGTCNNVNITGNNCGNGMLQSPNTVYTTNINIANNTLAQTYFPVPDQLSYQLKLVVAGNRYTSDTSYNTAPADDGSYGNINSFCVRTQYNLAAGTIASIAPSWVGRVLTFHSTNWFTIKQGNNIRLKSGASATAPANGRLSLKFDGTNWNEISRSF